MGNGASINSPSPHHPSTHSQHSKYQRNGSQTNPNAVWPLSKSDDEMSEHSFVYSSPSLTSNSASSSNNVNNTGSHIGGGTHRHKASTHSMQSYGTESSLDHHTTGVHGSDSNMSTNASTGNNATSNAKDTTPDAHAATQKESRLRWRVGIQTGFRIGASPKSMSRQSTQSHSKKHHDAKSSVGHRSNSYNGPSKHSGNSSTNGSTHLSNNNNGTNNASEAQLIRQIRHLEDECNKALTDKRRFAVLLSDAEGVIANRNEAIQLLEHELTKKSEDIEDMVIMMRRVRNKELRATRLAKRIQVALVDRASRLDPIVDRIRTVLGSRAHRSSITGQHLSSHQQAVSTSTASQSISHKSQPMSHSSTDNPTTQLPFSPPPGTITRTFTKSSNTSGMLSPPWSPPQHPTQQDPDSGIVESSSTKSQHPSLRVNQFFDTPTDIQDTDNNAGTITSNTNNNDTTTNFSRDVSDELLDEALSETKNIVQDVSKHRASLDNSLSSSNLPLFLAKISALVDEYLSIASDLRLEEMPLISNVSGTHLDAEWDDSSNTRGMSDLEIFSQGGSDKQSIRGPSRSPSGNPNQMVHGSLQASTQRNGLGSVLSTNASGLPPLPPPQDTSRSTDTFNIIDKTRVAKHQHQRRSSDDQQSRDIVSAAYSSSSDIGEVEYTDGGGSSSSVSTGGRGTGTDNPLRSPHSASNDTI